jgi:hypothetical protein
METRLLQFVSRVDGMPYGFHLKVTNSLVITHIIFLQFTSATHCVGRPGRSYTL